MLATKGDRLTTGEMRERFGVPDAVYLMRWHNRGWLRGVWANDEYQGPGGRILWEPWTVRIVPLLLGEPLPAAPGPARTRRRQLAALARAIAAAPDAVHYVWNGEAMDPAWTDELAVELLRSGPTPGLLVSPPPC